METLIATATFGLESVVSRELRELGYDARVRRPGRLAFEAEPSAIARANVWLRAADRVLVELAEFEADDFGALFDQTRALPWERFVPRDGRFPVRGRSVKSKLSSVPACQRIVKKAIVERLRSAHRVETLPEDGAEFGIEVALLNDRASLALDTSGDGLHKRGYRQLTGAAPLKETLAAGIILLSFWNRERAFLDPFCGTGTFAIEAALLAGNRAPGLLRSFVCEQWPSLKQDVFAAARAEARDLERPFDGGPIDGSDSDTRALTVAEACAVAAGVVDGVRFQKKDFTDIAPESDYGCLITNPPYGERMGEAEAVRELYRELPGVLRRFPTWSHYILTSHRELESLVGQPADRRRKLYNGRIECTLFQFLGPRPGSVSGEASFGGLDDKAARQMVDFENRLRKRARHLRKWPAKRGTDAYRIYDRDIKDVPLEVDRYGELYLLTPAYTTSKSRTRAEQDDWLDAAAMSVSEALEAPRDNVLVAGHESTPRRTIVLEEGLRFEVRLGAESEPGLSLEGRLLRKHVRAHAKARNVLCWPSRSGTYAAAAAAGDARSVTSSDDLEEHLAWSKRNFALNDLTADPPHRFVSNPTDEDRYDLIVVERPPTKETIETAVRLLADGGVLYVLAHDRHRVDGAEEVTESLLPEDFRSRRRVRLWRYQRSSG